MNLQNKKIGIWGFGVVGQSVFNYVKKFTNYVQILDKKPHADIAIIIQTPETIQKFLQENNYIIPSPGIILHDYEMYRHKFICELDLFTPNYKGTTIGITGTAGKTTVTDFIAQSIPNSIAAGNIGFAMLDVLNLNPQPQTIVLELSSYQLQHTNNFAPDIAIWTNFFANHLDHHKDIAEYFISKCNILKNQTKDQKAIVHHDLVGEILKKINYQGQLFTYSLDKSDNKWIPGSSPRMRGEENISFLKYNNSSILNSDEMKNNPHDRALNSDAIKNKTHITTPTSDSTCSTLNSDLTKNNTPPLLILGLDPGIYSSKNNWNIASFYLENNNLVLWQNGQTKTIFQNFNTQPKTTFTENWITIIAGLYLANKDLTSLNFDICKPQPHRVGYIGNYKNVAVYNDSKSTIQESTKQALQMFFDKKIAVIIGGLSKGTNREPLIEYIAQQKNITPFIFGGEKEILANFCDKHQKSYFATETLEQLLDIFAQECRNFDILLFSPAGSSFDRFKNYQDRGDKFKTMINKNMRETEEMKMVA